MLFSIRKIHLHCLSLVVSPMSSHLVKNSVLVLVLVSFYSTVSLLLHNAWSILLTLLCHKSFPVLNSDHLKRYNWRERERESVYFTIKPFIEMACSCWT